jgi:hypothetical protein
MKTNGPRKTCRQLSDSVMSELLILPDGRILVHNLTTQMAVILNELNPNDSTIKPRALTKLKKLSVPDHELSN